MDLIRWLIPLPLMLVMLLALGAVLALLAPPAKAKKGPKK
jgi:hypothetical protein